MRALFTVLNQFEMGVAQMIDWGIAFSTASQTLKLVKELNAVNKELDEAGLKLKIADLDAIAELKNTFTDAKAEAASKDEEIERLKKVNQRVIDDLVEQKGYLYRKQLNDETKPAGNPH